MPKLYTRKQGSDGTPRYYADLRDIGFGQYALKVPGSKRATADPVEAEILKGRLIERLTTEAKMAPPGSLKAASDRLVLDNPRGNEGKWETEMTRYLTRAVEFFGSDRPLDTIRPKDVREWQQKLTKEGYAAGTILHHLHALSAVYGYAQELEEVSLGYNPVSGLYGKPSASRGRTKSKKAKYLEINEAANLPEAARTLERTNRNGLIPFPYPLLATFLLTGGRNAEVLGLLVQDVDLDLETISFRPNDWRPLKRSWSERTLRLWPQLKEILSEYLQTTPPQGDLLFPSPRTFQQGREEMIWDLRKLLREASKEAKITPAPTPNVFRHTYATARLQTTDGGKQISLWQVAKEMGHRSVARVEDTYGHPSNFGPRAEVVEYRVEEQRASELPGEATAS